MTPITTVIITKNEQHNIEACITSAKLVSAEIIVVDCGSEDGTVKLAESNGAKVISVQWKCYGDSRNIGAAAASNDWILALDADERISPELARTLSRIQLTDKQPIYRIRRENYFSTNKLHFGTLGFERVPRLYNRTSTSWDLSPVHEKLKSTGCTRFIKESILHYGIPSLDSHLRKKEAYAFLSALKYLEQGRKASFLKRFLAPVFNGSKSYLFQLGFLDGKRGWYVAKTITYYTWLKYKYLHNLLLEKNKTSKDIAYAAIKTYHGL